mgnify:CR=1 FL=1|tara:strand:+ start:561 stop:968 length:408 start_codon:yes stop_codon:yes gene_type:complete
MIKKSKVTNVQANGTWEGKFGMMYKFEVSFENDDTGEYSSKSKEQDKFVVGQEMEYEYIDGRFPKVKPVYAKPDFSNNGFAAGAGYKKDDNVQKMIVKQSSLKAAVEFCNSSTCGVDDVIKIAQQFTDWVMIDKN